MPENGNIKMVARFIFHSTGIWYQNYSYLQVAAYF